MVCDSVFYRTLQHNEAINAPAREHTWAVNSGTTASEIALHGSGCMSVVNARPVDAPVVADGLPVQADQASRGCGHSLLTYSQTGVTLLWRQLYKSHVILSPHVHDWCHECPTRMTLVPCCGCVSPADIGAVTRMFHLGDVGAADV